jgi:mRNA-degrading endonuclease toxin of MazEF toxin-antitoxin module
MRFGEGDVVLVIFPWEEPDGRTEWKVRPAVVLEVDSVEERVLIQITTKNKSKITPGLWITKASEDGQKMGLLHDSFINVLKQKTIHIRDIKRAIGTCSERVMEKIHNIIKENK